MKELNAENFKKEVSKGLVLVDFYTPYCGPCIEMEPIFKAMEEKYKHKVKFCRINFDECGPIAVDYGVSEVPTVVVFKDGEEIDRILGSYSEYAFNAKISEWLIFKA